MEHAEARAFLEAAAVEPDGLARLEAGDTPDAAALAGHLAGCPSCAQELGRLRATHDVVREALRAGTTVEAPADAIPSELRGRTLAYVHAYGRPRGAQAPRGTEGVPAVPPRAVRRPTFGRAALLVGLAAALVVGVGLGGLVVGSQRQDTIDQQATVITALSRVNEWTVRVASASDSTSVALTSPTGGAATGSILYSPGTTELIAVMNGVSAPGAGREYRCWVRTGATSAALGRMYFGGDVGYWGGHSPAVADLPAGAVFGVSLVDVATGAPIGEPVLTGTL